MSSYLGQVIALAGYGRVELFRAAALYCRSYYTLLILPRNRTKWPKWYWYAVKKLLNQAIKNSRRRPGGGLLSASTSSIVFSKKQRLHKKEKKTNKNIITDSTKSYHWQPQVLQNQAIISGPQLFHALIDWWCNVYVNYLNYVLVKLFFTDSLCIYFVFLSLLSTSVGE